MISLRSNLAFSKSCRSCAYTFFLPKGGDIELIFVLRAAVSEKQAYFQNCHIWGWNLAIGQSSRSCTIPFYPGGSKLSLFLLYGWPFPRYWQFAFTHWAQCHISIFFFKMNLKFQNSKRQVLFGLLQGTFRKGLVEKEWNLWDE